MEEALLDFVLKCEQSWWCKQL